MSKEALQTIYGRSSEHDMNEDVSLRVQPVTEVHATSFAVEEALRRENIDDICGTIRNLAQTLRLRGCDFLSLESYLREQWDESTDHCVHALRNACVNRPEPDMHIESTWDFVDLSQGTHFVDLLHADHQRILTLCSMKGQSYESSAHCAGQPLRARITVGPDQIMRLESSGTGRLAIFSILNTPSSTTMRTQIGSPAYARYLDERGDAFMAGRHFPAEMLGDPSWHELKMAPNSTQVGFEHVHPHTRLVYVTEGDGVFQTGATSECADQVFELLPGKLIILTPGTWHRFSAGPTGLTVQPVHPVTPTSGASANSHEMFFGTLSDETSLINILKRGATR